MINIYNYRHVIKYILLSLLFCGITLMIYMHYKNFKKIMLHKNNTLQKIHQENMLGFQHHKIKQQFLLLQKKIYHHLQIDNKESRNAEILTALLRSGEINNVMINLLKPVQWERKLNLHQGILHLSVDGSFSAIWSWLSWIMNLEIPLFIEKLTIQPATDQLLHSELKISTFFIPATFSAARIKSAKKYQLEFGKTDLFNSSRFISSSEPSLEQNNVLRNISIKQLQWVGYLHHAQTTWAIAKLPDHQLVPITLHSKLGFEDAEVIQISSEEITIEMNGNQTKLSYGH